MNDWKKRIVIGDDGFRADHGWHPSPRVPKVYLKDVGSFGAHVLQLVRYDPGGSDTIDPSGTPILLYVLEGELIYGGRRLWCGAAESISSAAPAVEVRSEVGCTLLHVQNSLPAGTRAATDSTTIP